MKQGEPSTLVADNGYSRGYSLPQDHHGKKHFYFFLYVLFLLVLTYAVLDFQTSANSVVKTGERGGVHASLFVILLVFGIYYAFTFWRGNLFSPVIASMWLIAVWVGIANLALNTINWSAGIHFGLSCLWILMYHFFRYYIQRYPASLSRIKGFMAVMFLFYVYSAVYAMRSIHDYRLQMGHEQVGVINMAYNVIVFLPWLSLVSKKWLRFCGIGLVTLIVVASMKRGAIIIFPIMMTTWMLVEASVNKRRVGMPVLKIIITLLIFIAGLFVADRLSNGYLSERFSSKELATGSGRAHSYSFVLKDASGRGVVDLLLGYGSGLSKGVHNEWLEFLFTFGFVGVVLYALLFLSLMYKARHLMKNGSPCAAGFAMAVVYMFVVGMYGGIYFVHSTLYVMMFYGVAEGLMLNDSKESQISGSNYGACAT